MNILVTLIYFILPITWSLAYGCGQQRNRRDKRCRQIDDDFDGHGDVAVRLGVHRPMEHIQGFTRNAAIGQVPAPYRPDGLHGRRIRIKHTITNKTQLLPSNYRTFLLVKAI